MKYSKQILKNGLTIIQAPSSEAESVVVDFFVKTGSRSESEKENGISHFLEHFLFKGTAKYPSALAISELVDAIGGEMNANTGKEHTQYYIKAASKHLALIFEILTDMIKSPLLDSEELEREKGVIVEEINMYKDTPMYEVDNILENIIWPGIPLGRDIAGSKETVTKFDRSMFLKYINRHYQLSNMILGVSGKYDQVVLDGLIEKYWLKEEPIILRGESKKQDLSSVDGLSIVNHWEPALDVQDTFRVKLEYKATEQAHMALGFKGLAYKDKRNPVQSVLSAILGGGMSSRLFTEVREKRGLCYYVRASGSNYQDTGVFTIGSGVQVNKINEALDLIILELKKIKNSEVEPKELTKAKEYIKGKITLALEDNQSRLDWFLGHEAFHGEIETPSEAFVKIDAVTSEDVLRLAQELFQEKNMSFSVIGPYKNEEDFKKILDVLEE